MDLPPAILSDDETVLHEDILYEIAAYLPLADKVRCKRLNKTFASIVHRHLIKQRLVAINVRAALKPKSQKCRSWTHTIGEWNAPVCEIHGRFSEDLVLRAVIKHCPNLVAVHVKNLLNPSVINTITHLEHVAIEGNNQGVVRFSERLKHQVTCLSLTHFCKQTIDNFRVLKYFNCQAQRLTVHETSNSRSLVVNYKTHQFRDMNLSTRTLSSAYKIIQTLCAFRDIRLNFEKAQQAMARYSQKMVAIDKEFLEDMKSDDDEDVPHI